MLVSAADGVPLHSGAKESGYSVWVIVSYIANLPHEVAIQPHNMLVHGVTEGPAEPSHMQPYLGVFVDELIDGWHGFEISLPGDLTFVVRVMLLCLVADYPGMCKLLNRGSNNGHCGCIACKYGKEASAAAAKNVYQACAYPGPPHRTLAEVRLQGLAQNALRAGGQPGKYKEGITEHGCGGTCEFDRLGYFDILQDATFDTMHINSGYWCGHVLKLWNGRKKLALPRDPREAHKWGVDCKANLQAKPGKPRWSYAARLKKFHWRVGRVRTWIQDHKAVEKYNKYLLTFAATKKVL